MSLIEGDALRAKVRETLVRFAASKPESISRATQLVNDLGYHSLAMLEAIFTLEEELGVELVDDGTAGEITTVGDVEDQVAAIVARARA
jgi:acyl carrier protein